MGWTVVAEPHGENATKADQAVGAIKDAAGRETLQGKNTGGLVIFLQDPSSGAKHEISRVGFVRRNTKNPKVSFEKQLTAELKKAEEAKARLNELVGGGGGELQ